MFPKLSTGAFAVSAVFLTTAAIDTAQASLTSHITVPDGFGVEVAAAPPLVGFPMMGCFDERGRLFLAESAGFNMNIQELEKATPNFIRMLEDTNGDGVFDKSTIFVDKLQIPNGVLWHKGSLYVAEPPGIWRYTDTDGDGVADKREHLAGKVHSNGMSSTLHGPVLDPTGKLFWCGGQSGYELQDKDADLKKGRKAPGVFTLHDDGTHHEIFALGGLANPVEVAFGPEGDVFGTVAILEKSEGQRRDGLMHWIYGGVYNLNGTDPVMLPRTGDPLPPLVFLGQTAPSGIASYSGYQFGDAFKNNLFFAEFNTRQVIRARIVRDGATFRAETEVFLESDNIDFHATDVIEDADGSLLVIDTGGWFRHGCPTSQIAKPEVKGAIYRVRKQGAVTSNDPRGMKLDWAKMSAESLCRLLADAPPAVAERAVVHLAQKGEESLSSLTSILQKSDKVDARRNAVWALSRIGTDAAHQVLRIALKDKDKSIRQSAAYAAGSNRDKGAAEILETMVRNDSEPSVRREAAAALGRIGNAGAVPALLSAVERDNDAFLTHAIIFALIQINDPAATKQGLTQQNASVQRGALLALEQMNNSSLTREEIVPLLRSSNFDVQKTAFTIAGRRKDLTGESASALQGWLEQQELAEDQTRFIQEALSSKGLAPNVERLMGQRLSEATTSTPARKLLLEVIANSGRKDLPPAWIKGIGAVLENGTEQLRLQAIETIQQRKIKDLNDPLRELAKDVSLSPELRIAAMVALAPRLQVAEDDYISLLKESLRSQSSPVLRLASARALSTLPLSDEQILGVAAFLPNVDPLALPTVLRSFARKKDETSGRALIEGLEKTPAAQSLGVDELARIVSNYPETVQERAKPLLAKLGAELEQQQQHLKSLSAQLVNGDFKRGKEVFFGKKAACASCHRISGQGGIAGPNLSKIATIRNEHDLLESIVFPSASIVQGYHTFEIETKDGEEYTGIILRETPEAVWLRGSDLAEIRLETRRIKNMRESRFSIMPQGLEASLTSQELSDLMAYLLSLK